MAIVEDMDVYKTYEDGAIGISELSGGDLRIRTWREFSLTEAKTLKDEWMNFKKLFWVW